MGRLDQRGFTAWEALLIAVVVGVVGFTGFFVWQSQREVNKTYDDAPKAQDPPAYEKNSTQQDFENCKKAEGSRMLETYPEQCITKDGKTYITSALTATQEENSKNYLVISQWGIKLDTTNENDSFLYALGSGLRDESVMIGTSDSEKLGSSCVVAQNGVGGVVRSTTILPAEMGSRPSPLNDEKPINGYYYYYGHPQARCSDASSTADRETKAVDAVRRIVQTIRSE